LDKKRGSSSTAAATFDGRKARAKPEPVELRR